MISWLSDPTFVAGLFAGAAATLIFLLGAAVCHLLSRDHYGLDHWKLNVQLPISLWMNLGYWKHTSDFTEACRNYLKLVFETANILADQRSIGILDVGIGCGDQTVTVLNDIASRGAGSLAYIGVTNSQAQLGVASRRCHDQQTKLETFHLFLADASKPNVWSEETRSAVDKLKDPKLKERWLLASDCLYHFSPSRMPLWQYAARNLGMNFMGSDLCMSKTGGWRQKTLARTIGVLMGCPWKAFLTEEEYREQLVACGYDRESIIINDVSQNVFPGLVAFLERQDKALAENGISLGGGFRIARKVFGWFAVSKVVRAVIVVARLPKGKDAA
ncbi:hypothetical protein QBC41DRAFT_323253 [Cercophora samala]|uniref:S-adenosyl-L-methionine-dependent methyltransferase n=1 Tax=Cercophora samala TaxID=330535 RepID=A0AA39ZCF3_9PEZI|nr:hypothetical protein QBC41DRAFT_323253 [Cercophora samala]